MVSRQDRFINELETTTSPGAGSWIVVSDESEPDENDKTKKYPFDSLGKGGGGEGLEYIQIANVTQLATDRAAQATETSPKIFHLLTAMTYDGTDFKWGDTLWFPPMTTDYERGPNIPLYDFNYVTRHADTASEFNGYVNGHVGNDHYLFIRARGTFNATLLRNETYAVVAGETYWVYPRDYNPHRFISFTELADAAGYRKSHGVVELNPKNIATYKDVDGDRTVAVWGEDVDWLRRKQVNTVTIQYKDEPVHIVSPWTPASDFTIEHNVNTTEETQIGLTSTDKFVPVYVIYQHRDGGGGTSYVGQANGFMTIGDNSATSGGGPKGIPDKPANESQVTRWNLEVPATSGDGVWKKAESAPAAKLTQEQQIGLLNFRVEPEIIKYNPSGLEAALTTTIELGCANPELLTGDIWYQGSIDGQPVVARAKWSASTSAIRFVISSQLAGLIGQNPQLELDLSFYNVSTGSGAGTIVESLRFGVPLLELPGTNSGQSAEQVAKAIKDHKDDPNAHHSAAATPTASPQLTTQTLTSASALSWDITKGYSATVTLTHTATLSITGGSAGEVALLTAAQGGSGGRNLRLGTIPRFGGVDAPALNTARGGVNLLLFVNIAGTWNYVGMK